MELLHDSWPGFENRSMKPALKLLSITLHERLLWLCQKSCKLHYLLHFDPNPCRHIAASTLGSAQQSRDLRSVQHMAPRREGNTSCCHAKTRTRCDCLLSCFFSHLSAHQLQRILLTTHLTLPHIAPHGKHMKKSYGSM